jgi:hypothetical protein
MIHPTMRLNDIKLGGNDERLGKSPRPKCCFVEAMLQRTKCKEARPHPALSMNLENIQHSTSNTQHPMGAEVRILRGYGHAMSDATQENPMDLQKSGQGQSRPVKSKNSQQSHGMPVLPGRKPAGNRRSNRTESDPIKPMRAVHDTYC